MPALLLVCSHKVEGAAQIVPSISTFATTFITGDVLYTSRTELSLRARRLRYSYFFVPANILSTYSGFIDNRIAFKIKSSSFYILNFRLRIVHNLIILFITQFHKRSRPPWSTHNVMVPKVAQC